MIASDEAHSATPKMLDPEHNVLPNSSFRRSVIGAIRASMRGVLCDFDPRPAYSQNIEDYEW